MSAEREIFGDDEKVNDCVTSENSIQTSEPAISALAPSIQPADAHPRFRLLLARPRGRRRSALDNPLFQLSILCNEGLSSSLTVVTNWLFSPTKWMDRQPRPYSISPMVYSVSGLFLIKLLVIHHHIDRLRQSPNYPAAPWYGGSIQKLFVEFLATVILYFKDKRALVVHSTPLASRSRLAHYSWRRGGHISHPCLLKTKSTSFN